MNGTCSHCQQPGIVWRYRLSDVGLRFLMAECADRLATMGMHIEPVTSADPRAGDRGVAARRQPGVGIRATLRWIAQAAA